MVTSVLTVTLTQCRKTHQKLADESPQTDYEELIEKSKAMEDHVLAFKSKMEYYKNHADIKSGGELYSAGDAVDEIESLINYDSCNVSLTCIQKTFITSQITMPLDDILKINDPKLSELYYNIVMDTIQNQLERVSYDNPQLILVDIEFSNYDSNDDAVITIGSLIGKFQTTVLHNDNWWYGENMGLCGTGQYVPEDGASQLDQRVTNSLLPPPPMGASWRFKSIESRTIHPTQDPLSGDEDNYLDYKIFYASELVGPIDDDVKCMSQYEMNFYETHYIDYAETFEIDENKEFASCIISGEPKWNPYRIYHKYKILVGNKFIIWHE